MIKCPYKYCQTDSLLTPTPLQLHGCPNGNLDGWGCQLVKCFHTCLKWKDAWIWFIVHFFLSIFGQFMPLKNICAWHAHLSLSTCWKGEFHYKFHLNTLFLLRHLPFFRRAAGTWSDTNKGCGLIGQVIDSSYWLWRGLNNVAFDLEAHAVCSTKNQSLYFLVTLHIVTILQEFLYWHKLSYWNRPNYIAGGVLRNLREYSVLHDVTATWAGQVLHVPRSLSAHLIRGAKCGTGGGSCYERSGQSKPPSWM